MDPVAQQLVPLLAHGALASWLSQWLHGATSPEEVEVHLKPWGFEPVVHVEGRQEHLYSALGRWRRGHVSAHLRVIAPGMTAEPVNPTMDGFALEVGCRVDLISVDHATRRTVLVAGPSSHVHESLIDTSRPLAVPDGAALRRNLDEAINEATRALVDLDVARARPDLAAALAQAESAVSALTLPTGHSPRKIQLLIKAVRVLTMIEVARRDEGGALTAQAATSRSHELLQVGNVARCALEAAFDPR
jgi:hypothetical protein